MVGGVGVWSMTTTPFRITSLDWVVSAVIGGMAVIRYAWRLFCNNLWCCVPLCRCYFAVCGPHKHIHMWKVCVLSVVVQTCLPSLLNHRTPFPNLLHNLNLATTVVLTGSQQHPKCVHSPPPTPHPKRLPLIGCFIYVFCVGCHGAGGSAMGKVLQSSVQSDFGT